MISFRMNMDSSRKVDATTTRMDSLGESVEQGWWDKLKQSVPEELRCKKNRCSFAPLGHKQHGAMCHQYSLAETRLIIQYLIHYEAIKFGKGIRVWETMNSRGYLTHRTPQSLNNYFKRTILKDVKYYKLPADLEAKFLELINE